MEKHFEVFFTETVRSKVYIKAESKEEAERMFDDGEYETKHISELDAYNAEIEEVREIED